jgi:hypothetical protein
MCFNFFQATVQYRKKGNKQILSHLISTRISSSQYKHFMNSEAYSHGIVPLITKNFCWQLILYFSSIAKTAAKATPSISSLHKNKSQILRA